MANLNYLIPQNINVNQNQQTPADAFLRGMAGPLALSNQITSNALAQEKLKQFTDTRNALAEYAKTKDLTPMMGIDPNTAKTLMDLNNSQVSHAWEQAKTFSAGNPEAYPKVRESLAAAGVPDPMLPPVETIKTPEDMMNFFYKGDILKANLKAMSEPKVVGPGSGLYQGGKLVASQPGKPYTVQQGDQVLTVRDTPNGSQVIGSGSKWEPPANKWKPELLIPTTGKGPAIYWSPTMGNPPEDYTKASAVGSKLTEDNMSSIMEGLKQGTINPTQLSKRGQDYNTILAKAQKDKINIGQLGVDWKGAETLAKTMNNNQMVRFKTLSETVMGTIDRVSELADQLKLSGVPLYNAAKLSEARNLEGNSPKGQLIGQYMAAITTLKEEYANFAQGGFAPTESAFKLGNDLIKENYGSEQLKATLNETKRLINIRKSAFNEVQAAKISGPGGNDNTPAAGTAQYGSEYPKTLPTPGGGNAIFVGKDPKSGKPLYKWPDKTVRPAMNY